MTQKGDHKVTGVRPPKPRCKSMSKKIMDLLLQNYDKRSHKKKFDLDLREITLLDNQSTVDLFCNPELAHRIRNSRSRMQLRSNGGSMRVNQKATVKGYENEVWFSEKAIADVVALSNLIEQFRATHDSNEE